MPAPTLNSVTPASGSPGVAITCLGAGFDSGAQVGCPALVATTFVSAGEVRAAIPADLVGPAGGSMVVSVFVQNVDGTRSGILPFTVQFPYPAATLQSWTSVDAVAREVSGFKRGGRIEDATIEGWIRSVAQGINGVMLGRGLSLKSADWAQADAGTAMPTASGVLELVNRLGAAARLAAAIAGDFTQGEWGLEKSLRRDYERELKRLEEGGYDALFRPGSAKEFEGGDLVTDAGDVERAFTKEQIF